MPESQLKSHFADACRQTEKVDRLQRRSGFDFSCELLLLRHNRHRWTERKGSKGAGKRNYLAQQACSRCGNTDHTSANCPQSDKTLRRCGKVGHLASVSRTSGTSQPKAKGGQKGKGGGKSANAAKTCGNCGESGHTSQCPKKKAHAVEESTTASQAGSQDTIMVGSVGSDFDVGSVSEADN